MSTTVLLSLFLFVSSTQTINYSYLTEEQPQIQQEEPVQQPEEEKVEVIPEPAAAAEPVEHVEVHSEPEIVKAEPVQETKQTDQKSGFWHFGRWISGDN